MFANYQDNNIIKEEDRIYEVIFRKFYTWDFLAIFRVVILHGSYREFVYDRRICDWVC